MLNLLKGSWAFWVSIIVLLIWLAATGIIVFQANDGRFAYPLDDSYIHMAIAKNIVVHRVWGVSFSEWSSSSSSILWTLLLTAAFALLGVRDWIPLALNVLAGIGVLAAAYHLLHRQGGMSQCGVLAVLLALTALTPLPAVIFTGMEHTLHIGVILLLVIQAIPVLDSPGRVRWQSAASLALLGLTVLSMLVRYESLFVIAAIGGLFYISRRPTYPVLLAGVALLPVVIYGVISSQLGGLFLPNSLLLKGGSTIRSAGGLLAVLRPDFVYEVFRIEAAPVTLIVLLSAAVTIHAHQRGGALDRGILIGIIALAASLMHLITLSRLGAEWDVRYKAYIMALLIISLGAAAQGILSPSAIWRFVRTRAGTLIAPVALVVGIVGAVPLARYAAWNQGLTTRVSHEIYIQQIMMATFLDEYYAGEVVGINDIGAINFYARSRNIDLVGLGNNELTRGLFTGQITVKEYLAGLPARKGMRIAVIYESWFKDILPPTWIKVGVWNYGDTAVVGPVVSFYAVSPDDASSLREHMLDFQNRLPDEGTLELGPGQVE